MKESDFVRFACPCCAAQVWASPNAKVGHLCRKALPRPKFVEYKRDRD